jgi:hypothetical protein
MPTRGLDSTATSQRTGGVAIALRFVSSFRQQSESLLNKIDGGSDLANGFNVLLRRRRRNEAIEFSVRWRTALR